MAAWEERNSDVRIGCYCFRFVSFETEITEHTSRSECPGKLKEPFVRLYFSTITTHPPPLHHHQPGRNYNLIPLDYFIKPDILSLALIYSDPNVVVPLVSTPHVHCTPYIVQLHFGSCKRVSTMLLALFVAWCSGRPYLTTINFHYRSTLSHLDARQPSVLLFRYLLPCHQHHHHHQYFHLL